MFGDDLLVVPVLEPGLTAWTVYLPGPETWVIGSLFALRSTLKCAMEMLTLTREHAKKMLTITSERAMIILTISSNGTMKMVTIS